MKKLFFLSVVITVLFSCSGNQSKSNFTGNVALTTGHTDSIYVGLYFHGSYGRNGNWAWLSDPKYLVTAKDNKFSINAAPGRYTLVAFAYGYEPVKKRVLIKDKKTTLNITISLEPIGIPSEINSVKLVGDFCKWNAEDGLSMMEKNGKWITESKDPIQLDAEYQFLVDDVPKQDLVNKNHKLWADRADFVSIYQGDSIIFDPAQYAQTIKKSSANLSGCKFLPQYDQFCKEFNDSLKALGPSLENLISWNSEQDEIDTSYVKVMAVLDSFEKKYDPRLKQLILELRLGRLRYGHPMKFEYKNVWVDKKRDSLKLAEFMETELFHDYFGIQLGLLKKLDPESNLLDGYFCNSAVLLDYFLTVNPQLKTEYNLTDDYFFNFLVDFVKESSKKTLGTHVLFHSAYDYAKNNQPEKVTFLINWLKEEYADEFYVGKGHADNILASLGAVEGCMATDFTVTTNSGANFNLSDYKGKFVFIDFWGTWCGPCLGELPHNKKLAQAVSKDKLKIIGLAKDDSKKLKEFLIQDPLPYENAVAPEKVLNAYGITSFPTTFLIDPTGKIVAKNLRGKELADLVKKQINAFN